MNKTFRLIVFLLTLVLLMVVSIVSAISYTNRYIDQTRYRFFCEDIQIGMSKDDIKRVIDDKYGSYSWRDDGIVGLSYVYFNRFVLIVALGNPVSLRFDNDSKLLGISSYKKVGDEVQINCNK
jgi:hypothetical protein